MRFFELLIIITIVITSINFVFLRRLKSNLILSLISFIFCIFSIALGGYRLQMLPAYFLSVILLFIKIICKFLGQFKVNRVFKALGIFMLTLVLIVSIAFPLAFSIVNIPKPQGSYFVGTTYMSFTDTSRKGIFTGANDYRKLAVQVWYPADNVKGKKAESYFPSEKCSSYLSKYMNSINIFGQFELSKTNSFLDVKLSSKEAKYPIIIFSHGYGGFQGQNTVQMEELASHGYVVFSISHTYEAFVSIFPDGQIVPYSPERYKAFIDEQMSLAKSIEKDSANIQKCKIVAESVHIWSDDTRFVINQIEKINSGEIRGMFSNRLDVSKIGAMGHSVGGATAGQACIEDSRIKAFINLDGVPLGDAIKSIIKQPFMLMVEPSSKNPIIANYHPQQKNYLTVTVKGTKHMNFTDDSVLFPIGKYLGFLGSIDGEKQMQIVNDYTLSFFNKYLKGMREPLIDSLFPKYSEVTVQ